MIYAELMMCCANTASCATQQRKRHAAVSACFTFFTGLISSPAAVDTPPARHATPLLTLRAFAYHAHDYFAAAAAAIIY